MDSRRYEVVVTVPESREGAVEELRKFLRAQDRLIAVKADERFALYAAAAKTAKGALLVFTEDHCIAEADCLAAVKRHFERTGDACATLRWGHINRNNVALMEERLSHIDEKVWFGADHWNKVRVRGFAIRRHAYWDVGGFDWPYALFAEAALSARLHSRGHRVGHIIESGIRHINTETLSELFANAWSYSWGECAYCHNHEAEFCEPYFAASTVLERDSLVPRGLSRWMAFALLKVLLRDRTLIGNGKSSLSGALIWAARLVLVSFETPMRRLLAWPKLWSARLRFHLWRFNEERQFRAFSQFWRRVVQIARLTYAAKHGLHARRQSAAIDPANFIIAGGIGCFGVERYRGRDFRWTSPVALLQLTLSPGGYRLTIDTGGLQSRAWRVPLGIYWNRHLIPQNEVLWDQGVMSVAIKERMCRPGSTQELTLACAPARRKSDADRRWRGLPICSVDVRPLSAGHAQEVDAVHVVEGSARRATARPKQRPVANQVSNPDPPRGVLIVSTADEGSGAEAVAWELYKGYRRRGMKARMWVGQKTTDDPDVVHSFRAMKGQADPIFSRFRRRAAKAIGSRLGWEDFEFPATKKLRDACDMPADIVHCHNLHGGYFDLRELATLSQRAPVFVTLHDCWLFTGHCAFPQECPRWEKGCGNCPDLARYPAIQRDATSYNWRRKARIFAQSKLHIATPSAWLLEQVQRSMLTAGMIEGRVIANGIDLDIFHPVEKSAARSRVNVSPEVSLLVFAARNGAANSLKDFPTLRAALAELCPNGPIHCVAIGRAAATEELSNGVRISHLPLLNKSELAQWLQAADLCVQATVGESFSLIAAESLACGTPVVATKVGGLPEVVRDGQDGLLVPERDPRAFASAMTQLLGDPARRAAMGRQGAEWAASRFDRERMIDDYVNWFESATNKFTARRDRAVRNLGADSAASV